MLKGNIFLVYGAGISGQGVAQVLATRDHKVFLYDDKPFVVSEKLQTLIKSKGGKLVHGVDKLAELINEADTMVISPGISIYNPNVMRAKELGKTVISEIEVAYQMTPAKIIAITGTNGKTTTTSLLGEMLATLPTKTAVGGNIGQALSLEAEKLDGANNFLAAEISSFQLEGIDTFKPHICSILNLTPDHLDRHKTFEEYAAVKAKIFQNQTYEDYLIVSADDPIVKELAQKAKSKKFYISTKEELHEGAYLENNKITLKDNSIKIRFCDVKEMQIFGQHNIENALVAIACAFMAGVSVSEIINVLRSFKGVEHRIEYVTTVNNVKYYNDSKATNPESVIKALEAFEDSLILLAGGYDKMTDLTELMQLAKEKTRICIFFGNARQRFAEAALRLGVDKVVVVPTLNDAVTAAYKLAEKSEVVLLSPACSSYDAFKNFEERGRVFKELVQDLKN